jgi:AcrR family transcriptional regulator
VQTAPLRADARRNREQIIEAARELFIRVGTDVPMEEIAKTAGVGVGTLYRRFPDRDELIKAVSLDNFGRLLEVARRIEREEPNPATALGTLLHSSLELRLGITMTAVSPRTFESIQHSPELTKQRDEVIGIASRLLERAQQDGEMRTDIGIGDVVLALIMVSRLIPPTDSPLSEMVFRRLVTLMMDGLRGNTTTPLPGRPIGYDDVDELRLKGFGKAGPAR